MTSPGSSPSRRLALLRVSPLLLVVAACAPAPAPSPGVTLTPTVPPTAASTSVPASSTPPGPTPAATPSGTVFESAAYGYSIALPGGWTAAPAREPWDGSTQINSDGPYVDRFTGPDGELFFVYATLTQLDLAGFAQDQQVKVSMWHGCPERPSRVTETVVPMATGTTAPARAHEFLCQGLYVFKLMAVADGTGIVVNELHVPGDESSMRAAFLARVAAISWNP